MSSPDEPVPRISRISVIIFFRRVRFVPGLGPVWTVELVSEDCLPIISPRYIPRPNKLYLPGPWRPSIRWSPWRRKTTQGHTAADLDGTLAIDLTILC
jgi:hypothetical protein